MMRVILWKVMVGGALAGGFLGWVPAGSAAQEQTALELYGNFRYALNGARAQGESHWTGVNNASRVGVRGALARDDWELFYHLETGAHVDAQGAALSPRFYMGGIRGPLGELTVGRHSPAYKMPFLQVDPFYDMSTLSAAAQVPVEGVFAGASYGSSALANGWANRAAVYTTPEHHGFTGSAALYLDPDGRHDYAGGLSYAAGELQAGFRYHEHRSEGRNWTQAEGVDRAFRGHVLFGEEEWSVGFTAERVELVLDDAQHFVYASGTLRPTDASRVSLAFGSVGSAAALGSMPPGVGIHGGAFYELVEGGEIFALASTASLDDVENSHVASLGLTVDFGWSP